MKLEQSFDVKAPMDDVWRALIDIERVAPCLPGASVSARNPDGSYTGEFVVKIGPASANYAGKLEMTEVDESSHAATLDASGTDRRGQGNARATIGFRLADAGQGSTTVSIDTDYRITGRLARFGRGGMIEEIANRLLSEFALALQEMVGGGGGGAPEPSVPSVPSEPAGPSADVLAAQDAATEVEVAAAPSAPEPAPPEPEPEPTPAPAPPEPEPEPEPEREPEPEPSATVADVPAPILPDGAADADAETETATAEPLQTPDIVSEAPAEPLAPVPNVPTGTGVPPSQPTISAAAPEPEPAEKPAPPAPDPAPQAASAPDPPPAFDAGALVRRTVVERVRQNPAPVVAAVVGLIVLRTIRRRRR